MCTVDEIDTCENATKPTHAILITNIDQSVQVESRQYAT